MSDAGQKKIRTEITDRLGKEWNTKVSVGKIGWNPLDGFTVKDAFIRDQHDDTLFFIGDIRARLGLLDQEKHFVYLKKVQLDQVLVNFRQYAGEDVLNYEFFFDALDGGPRDTTRAPVTWTLLFEKVKLRNACFQMRFDDDTVTGRAFHENDMRFDYINADLHDFYVVDDSLNFQVRDMSLAEHTSFEIRKMDAHAIICAQGMYFSDLLMETPHSSLRNYFALEYSHWSDFNNFYDGVKMVAHLENSKVSFKDINLFSDELLDWRETVYLEGDGSGVLRNMRAKNLHINFGQSSELLGSLTMKGLPNIDETFIEAHLEKANATRDELASLIPLDVWPKELGRLGNIEFKGNFTGFIYDFVAFGDFDTDLGFLRTDINMKLNEPEEYSGTLSSVDFDLGSLLDLPELGRISFDGQVNGKSFELATMETRIEAKVKKIGLYAYPYQNIQVNGLLKNQFFEGNLQVDDPNLKMNFDGKVSLSGDVPVFDCVSDFYYADFVALNWAPDFPATASGEVHMDFVGTELDDFEGSIRLGNVEIERNLRVYTIDSMILLSTRSPGYRSISLHGDILDAEIKGDFSPSLLDKSFNNYLVQLLPNSTQLSRVELAPQDFTFEVELKKGRQISELIYPGSWVDKGSLSGFFNSSQSTMALKAGIDEVNYEGLVFHQLGVHADSSIGDEKFGLQVYCGEITKSDSTLAHGINFDLQVLKNDVAFEVEAYSEYYSSEVKLNGNVLFSDTSIYSQFRPSYVQIDSLLWEIADHSRLGILHDSIFVVDSFELSTISQSVTCTGALYGDDRDRLFLDFREFDLSVLNPFIFTEDEGSIEGIARGNINIQSFKGSIPLFTSNLNVEDLGLNGERMGDLELNARVPKGYELITVHGFLKDGLTQRIGLAGFVNTAKHEGSYNLKLEMDTTPLHLFEPFLVDLVSELRGTGNGSVWVSGPLDKPVLKGKIHLNQAGMKVDYLSTSYSFNSTVNLSSSRIDLGRFKVVDERNNDGYCSGFIGHDFFKDFNLNIELSNLKNFLCMNTTIEENEYYYGTALMSGSARFTGSFDDLKIDVKGKAEKGSAFFVPLENYGGSSELEFIHFVNFNEVNTSQTYQDLSGIQMNFDLEITPSTEIQLIFDSKLGDIIRARGNSQLLMEINSNGDFKMYGEYVVEEGDYLFTAVNLINKKFEIERGGKITWNGDPMQANMDLEAIYHTKASVENLVIGVVPSDDLPAYRQRTDVEAVMKLRGPLTEPEIRFDFRLPNMGSISTSGVNVTALNTIIRRIESDQEEMTRQVFSLLVANTFIRPAVNQQYTGTGDIQAGLFSSSVGDLLSNQVSNWLGQMNTNWNFGVNYVMGNQQSDLLFNASRKFLDDRLEIEGTFATNSNFYNNISAMYSITPDGQLRVRAFNRTGTIQGADQNNPANANLNRNINTQGVGLYYSIEFDNLDKDRKAIRKKLKEQKKEAENP